MVRTGLLHTVFPRPRLLPNCRVCLGVLDIALEACSNERPHQLRLAFVVSQSQNKIPQTMDEMDGEVVVLFGQCMRTPCDGHRIGNH